MPEIQNGIKLIRRYLVALSKPGTEHIGDRICYILWRGFFFGRDSSTINLKRKQICAPGTVVPRNFDKYLGQSTEIIYGLRGPNGFCTLCTKKIELSDIHQ